MHNIAPNYNLNVGFMEGLINEFNIRNPYPTYWFTVNYSYEQIEQYHAFDTTLISRSDQSYPFTATPRIGELSADFANTVLFPEYSERIISNYHALLDGYSENTLESLRYFVLTNRFSASAMHKPKQPLFDLHSALKAFLANADMLELSASRTEWSNDFAECLKCYARGIDPYSLPQADRTFHAVNTELQFKRDTTNAMTSAIAQYVFSSLEDLLIFDFHQLVANKSHINMCESCGKVFIPQSRSDEKYCSYILRDDKTCRDIGYANKIKANDVTKEYRRIYQKQNAKLHRNKDLPGIQERFDSWKADAKAQELACINGKISVEKMIADIDNNYWIYE